jgi:hypothetical protein
MIKIELPKGFPRRIRKWGGVGRRKGANEMMN